MKRYHSSGRGTFARYGLRAHTLETRNVYRGGTRL